VNCWKDEKVERKWRTEAIGCVAVSHADCLAHLEFMKSVLVDQLKEAKHMDKNDVDYAILEHKREALLEEHWERHCENNVHQLSIHSQRELRKEYSVGFLNSLVQYYGANIMILWKLLLLRKRVILYSDFPLAALSGRTSALGGLLYCESVADPKNGEAREFIEWPRQQSGGDETVRDSIELQDEYRTPLLHHNNVEDSLIDEHLLETACNVLKHPKELNIISIEDLFIDELSEFYVAGTADKIFVHKEETYDAFFEGNTLILSEIYKLQLSFLTTPTQTDLLHSDSLKINANSAQEAHAQDQLLRAYISALNSNLLHVLLNHQGKDMPPSEVAKALSTNPRKLTQADYLFLDELNKTWGLNIHLSRPSELWSLTSWCCST